MFDASTSADELDAHVFDLANCDRISYRGIQAVQKPLSDNSGGVVWEAAHVLLEYFLPKTEASATPIWPYSHHPTPAICELGSGCGLLGMALARYLCPSPRRVVLTECAGALAHLQSNVERNAPHPAIEPEVQLLDWFQPDVAAIHGPEDATVPGFDVIVGTDVMFAPDLIRPLLTTAALLCRDSESVVWLAAPRRCDRAWGSLVDEMPKLFTMVELVTPALHAAVPVAARLEVELWRCSGVRRSAPPVAAGSYIHTVLPGVGPRPAAAAAAETTTSASPAASDANPPAVDYCRREGGHEERRRKGRHHDQDVDEEQQKSSSRKKRKSERPQSEEPHGERRDR